MAEPDAIFANGRYMNVDEGQLDIGVYRYLPCFLMTSTLLLNVTYVFFRYCDICIDDRHLYKWHTRKPENSKKIFFMKSLSHKTYIRTPQLFLYMKQLLTYGEIKCGGHF